MQQPGAMADMCRNIDTVIYHNTCPMCGKVEDQTVEVPEFAREFLKGGNTENFCEMCHVKYAEMQKAQYEKNRRDMLLENSGIPKDFLNWDKEKGNSELARQILNNNKLSLFVGGKNNCCKTRATAYNLKLSIIKEGKDCCFVRFSDLAAGYARVCKLNSENSSQYIRELLQHDILLIDDIGKRRITETAGELLYDLFDLVYSGEYSTLLWVTSNKSLEDLAEAFADGDIGDAVVSRIDRMIESGRMVMIEATEKAK